LEDSKPIKHHLSAPKNGIGGAWLVDGLRKGS